MVIEKSFVNNRIKSKPNHSKGVKNEEEKVGVVKVESEKNANVQTANWEKRGEAVCVGLGVEMGERRGCLPSARHMSAQTANGEEKNPDLLLEGIYSRKYTMAKAADPGCIVPLPLHA